MFSDRLIIINLYNFNHPLHDYNMHESLVLLQSRTIGLAIVSNGHDVVGASFTLRTFILTPNDV